MLFSRYFVFLHMYSNCPARRH